MRVNALFGEPCQVNDVVVLVDVFRSSTSIVTALERGCDFVKPFKEASKALKLKEEHPRKEDIILVGEESGETIEEFDMNISPTSLSGVDLDGKIVFYRSSNLTRVLDASKEAEEMIIGGFINAKFVAEYLKEVNPQTLDVIACGISEDSKSRREKMVRTEEGIRLNELTIEDLVGSGAIINRLETQNMSDLALLARLAYRNEEWRCEVRRGFISEFLDQLDYGEDIDFCLQENEIDIVPVYRGDRIVPAEFSR